MFGLGRPQSKMRYKKLWVQNKQLSEQEERCLTVTRKAAWEPTCLPSPSLPCVPLSLPRDFFTSAYLIDWKLPEGTFSIFSILASHVSTIRVRFIGVSTYCLQLCSDLNGPLTRSFRTEVVLMVPFKVSLSGPHLFMLAVNGLKVK